MMLCMVNAKRSVLILQNLTADHAAGLATWLQQHGVPFDCRNAQAGDAYPNDIAPYAALALLGGAMSANDDMPHLRQAERLIRQAMAQRRPVLGHCLGGQLMARALGAQVRASPAPEIGWHPVWLRPEPLAREWFGHVPGWHACQWHFDAFGLPQGAVSLATSLACQHQAFAVERGGVQHLAMQFHIEVDAAKHHAWSTEVLSDHAEALIAHPGSVSSGQAMRSDAAWALPMQLKIADRVYRRWLAQAPQ